MSDAHEEPVHVGWLSAALLTWFVSAGGHGYGLILAGKLFAWAKTKGTLHPDGGQAGLRLLEIGMASLFGGVALIVVAFLAWRLRQVPRQRLQDAAIPWLAWITLTYLVWKCFIVYPTELIHFGQYFVVGMMMAWALGKGRRPMAAFLITVSLGLIDEIFQHYWLAHYGDPFAFLAGPLSEAAKLEKQAHQLQKWMSHWMDWSDPILDACGAAGGILPFVTLRRLAANERGEELPETWGQLRAYVIVIAILLLPLLLLDPAVVGDRIGHYKAFPFWGEYDNDKPTHWPSVRDGVPILLACLVILGLLLEPRRRQLSQRAIAALLILAVIAVDPPSRKKGQPVHERVPFTQAIWTDQPIKIDGNLDEPVWKRAQRLGPFRDNKSGKPSQQETYAYVVWSNQGLYVGFECYDDDIWARDVPRDTQSLPGDEVVEVFLDDGGDEINYYEIEVSPKNVVYDLLCFMPQAPMDFNPSSPFLAYPNWDGNGIKTAVAVDGTVHTRVSHTFEPPRTDTDRRWTVEVFIPWQDVRAIPGFGVEGHRHVPPRAGDRWRLGLYRIDRPRPDPQEMALPPMSQAEVKEFLSVDDKTLEALIKTDVLRLDDDGRYLRGPVANYKAYNKRGSYQAWSPTWQASYHRPAFFGALEFVK